MQNIAAEVENTIRLASNRFFRQNAMEKRKGENLRRKDAINYKKVKL